MKRGLLGLIFFALTFSAHAFTVGKVDVQKVLLSIKQGKNIQERLKKEFEKKKKVLKKEEGKIRDAQKAFEKKSLVMNEQTRRKEEVKLQQMLVALQKKTVTYQKEMNDLEQKEKKPILEKLKPILNQVSKDAKVSITFEVSSAPVVYAEKEVDLTARVIKAYDKKYPK